MIRRCRAVTKLGPGGLQSWACDIIAVLREARQAVAAARARGDTALDPQLLEDPPQISARAFFAPGCADLGSAARTFAVLWSRKEITCSFCVVGSLFWYALFG